MTPPSQANSGALFTVNITVATTYAIPVNAANPDDARQLAREHYDAADAQQRAAWLSDTDKPRDYMVFDQNGNEQFD